MTLSISNQVIAISRSHFAELLLGAALSAVPQSDVDAINIVRDTIIQAGEGRLPKPQHHSHSFETPITGTLVHWSLGSRYPHSLLWWTGVWILVCGWVALPPGFFVQLNAASGSSQSRECPHP